MTNVDQAGVDDFILRNMQPWTDAAIEAAVRRAENKHQELEMEKQRRDGIHTSVTGVNRSDPTGKPDFTLLDWDAIERWAIHMTSHVASKGHNNWRNAGPEDELRALQSFWRHAIAWARGDKDEDHGSALHYNIALREYASRD